MLGFNLSVSHIYLGCGLDILNLSLYASDMTDTKAKEIKKFYFTNYITILVNVLSVMSHCY